MEDDRFFFFLEKEKEEEFSKNRRRPSIVFLEKEEEEKEGEKGRRIFKESWKTINGFFFFFFGKRRGRKGRGRRISNGFWSNVIIKGVRLRKKGKRSLRSFRGRKSFWRGGFEENSIV